MDWLKRDIVVDMLGPLFMLLYAGFIVLVLVLCWWRVRVAEPGAALPPPSIPARPDPYAIAYLRSGANEVARLVVFALLQEGFLRVTSVREANQAAESNRIERVANGPEASRLSGIERHALEWFDRPREIGDIFQTDGLKSRLADYCAEYEQRLRNEHLLTSDVTTSMVSRTGSYGALAIVIVGGVILSVARLKGVVGQEDAGLVACVGLLLAFLLPFLILQQPRLSRRGRACLRQLEVAFGEFKSQAAVSQTAGILQPPSRPRNDAVRAVSSAPMIVLGVFGHKVLSGSAPAEYGRLFPQAPNGDCGASCSCG